MKKCEHCGTEYGDASTVFVGDRSIEHSPNHCRDVLKAKLIVVERERDEEMFLKVVAHDQALKAFASRDVIEKLAEKLASVLRDVRSHSSNPGVCWGFIGDALSEYDAKRRDIRGLRLLAIKERERGVDMIKMQQVHSKFKVFIPEAGLTDDEAMRRLSSMVETFARPGNLAPKSVGVEYLESQKQIVLSLGYRDDEPGYRVKLTSVSLGKLALNPEAIEQAMSNAALTIENVICHEFFVDAEGVFVMVLLSHG